MTTTQRTAAQLQAAQASHDQALKMGASCTTQKLAGGSLRKDDRTPDRQTPNATAASLASAGSLGSVRSPASNRDGKTLEQGQNATGNAARTALPDNSTRVTELTAAELKLAQGIHDAAVALGAQCQMEPAPAKAVSAAELQKLVEDPLAAMKAVHAGGGMYVDRKR